MKTCVMMKSDEHFDNMLFTSVKLLFARGPTFKKLANSWANQVLLYATTHSLFHSRERIMYQFQAHPIKSWPSDMLHAVTSTPLVIHLPTSGSSAQLVSFPFKWLTVKWRGLTRNSDNHYSGISSICDITVYAVLIRTSLCRNCGI